MLWIIASSGRQLFNGYAVLAGKRLKKLFKKCQPSTYLINYVNYSLKNNYFLFKYLFYHYNLELTDFLWDQPLLFKLALNYIDYLIANYGQTKPYELIEIAKGEKRPPLGYTYGNPHFEKRSLASLLIKNGRAGYKTDNHPTTDLDVDKSSLIQPVWRQEAFKQFQRLAKSLNLDLRETPSGGLHLLHHRIKGQTVFKSSNLYFHGKATYYQSLHIGEFKAQGGLVIHPLSKDYLPKLSKEFLLNWRKNQKKTKKFAYLTEQQRNKIYSRFGFYFNNLKKRKILVKVAKIALNKVKKPNLFANSYLIPKITGEISVKNSQLGKSFDTYQQVIYTDYNNQKYSVLFNCESNLSKQYFLNHKVGNFATTFYLQASRQGSFIKNNFSP